MTPLEKTPPPGAGLAWVAFGVTVAGVAFAVRPVRASSTVYLVLLAVAAVAVGIGFLLAARRWRERAATSPPLVDPHALLARECRRVHDQLELFIAERSRREPRLALMGRGDSRADGWRKETCGLYRAELRAWATTVYRAAVAAGAAPASAEALVDAPSAAQLPALRDLFREAANHLEREAGRD